MAQDERNKTAEHHWNATRSHHAAAKIMAKATTRRPNNTELLCSLQSTATVTA
jgi:hypothetical protein